VPANERLFRTSRGLRGPNARRATASHRSRKREADTSRTHRTPGSPKEILRWTPKGFQKRNRLTIGSSRATRSPREVLSEPPRGSRNISKVLSEPLRGSRSPSQILFATLGGAKSIYLGLRGPRTVSKRPRQMFRSTPAPAGCDGEPKSYANLPGRRQAPSAPRSALPDPVALRPERARTRGSLACRPPH